METVIGAKRCRTYVFSDFVKFRRFDSLDDTPNDPPLTETENQLLEPVAIDTSHPVEGITIIDLVSRALSDLDSEIM